MSTSEFAKRKNFKNEQLDKVLFNIEASQAEFPKCREAFDRQYDNFTKNHSSSNWIEKPASPTLQQCGVD